MARIIAAAIMPKQMDGARDWWRQMASGKGFCNKMVNNNGNIGKHGRTDRRNGSIGTGWVAYATVVVVMVLEGDCNSD